eukprot:CAMPEP_0183332880 /NCGR_PEP_ID=MMETSP0164_2-20130417/1938_1 /TAXON_ID=221442 /ORGANISM="Coccolithus pelagicus ssp braarudi, Strain PLY182g" /LENGTH=156 /DNA_ID=CAMNT_0025501687 /DNA_START=156 /DNA_END=624 /DNA_ORIENTATION=-
MSSSLPRPWDWGSGTDDRAVVHTPRAVVNRVCTFPPTDWGPGEWGVNGAGCTSPWIVLLARMGSFVRPVGDARSVEVFGAWAYGACAWGCGAHAWGCGASTWAGLARLPWGRESWPNPLAFVDTWSASVLRSGGGTGGVEVGYDCCCRARPGRARG